MYAPKSSNHVTRAKRPCQTCGIRRVDSVTDVLVPATFVSLALAACFLYLAAFRSGPMASRPSAADSDIASRVAVQVR